MSIVRKDVYKRQPIPTPGPETVTVKAITGEAYIYALANLNSTIYYLDDADKNKLTGRCV